MDIVLKTDVSEADVAAISAPLLAFNRTQVSRRGHYPFVLHLLDDAGTPIGGASGRGAMDWLILELLFVPDALRGRGIGSRLMAEVERFALDHKLVGIWLDTYDFQAKPFYEKHGFTVFGVLDDHPIGGKRYFMQKRWG